MPEALPFRLAAPLAVLCGLLAFQPDGAAQVMDGRLEVVVVDPDGRGVPASVGLASRSQGFAGEAVADERGSAFLRRLPPGSYLLTVSHPGFEGAERRVEIRSAVPQTLRVTLAVAGVREEITVRSSAPLFEPFRPAQGTRVGRAALDRALGTSLGRSTVDVVTTTPGWLLEANAVLHPRGSEYDTQYVIDGMPLYDNRSLAFAPAFENSEFEAVTVLTAGIPAEYGRRLGGVIALDTRRTAREGHRSTMQAQRGAYGTGLGSLSHQYARERTELSVGLRGGATDRFLDPPSLENFTNKATSAGANARLSRDLSATHRLAAYLRSNRTAFLVPNDLEQQAAGQRQDRRSVESAGQLHYQATLSPRALLSARGMVRDLASELWSNALSTPVYVLQDRGLRETAVLADVTVDAERHTLKFGGDLRTAAIRERFQMADPGRLPDFDLDFRDRRRSWESSLFVQDQWRAGDFAASMGVRFDQYSLLVSDRAVSPRLAASYYLASAALQLYAAYDRVFQPPPHENLLLSSAGTALGIDDVEGVLAVPASRAHFFEVGARKRIGSALRIDAKHFWRSFRNPIDDDVFFNTGLSFPITFDAAEIEGTEARIDLPSWKRLSAAASYSNMVGRTTSPVTGGLFVEGGEAEELRDVAVEFPISQDQRNTLAATVRFEFHRRAWASFGVRYGSGLPVELEDDDDDEDENGDENGEGDDDGDLGDDDEGDDGGPDAGGHAIPGEILRKVDFQRSRVRPNLSLDFSVGARVWEREARSLTLQFDMRNATGRLNVINFSGLFSGTALAPGRQATLQLRLQL